jgi:hypothetical protein
MSNAPVQELPPVRGRHRRRWRWAVVCAAIVAVAGAGICAYFVFMSDRDLHEAIAEADRLDQGWRFEEIQAARVAVPDDENSAPIVAAAYAQIPRTFLAPRADQAPGILERLEESLPSQRLDDARLLELRAELAKAAAALPVARDLADRPRGRWAVAWVPDFPIATLMPHLEQARRVEQLLVLDAAAAAADGDPDRAVRSCRAALNAGRSMGDEPAAISQLIRRACGMNAVSALERVLAQGEASAPALEAMQRLLADEANAPLLLISVRADRAMWFQTLEAMRTSGYNRAALRIMPSRLGERFDMQVERVLAHGAEPAFLRFSTALVEIAKLPSHEQEERLRKLEIPSQKLPALLEGLTGGGKGIDWVNIARQSHRHQALLRCAEAALAAERYHLAEHAWPGDLNALVPRYLPAIPTDPFDGQPLRMRHLPDGMVVYSIGPDRTDDGGKLNRSNPIAANTDIGFQLWDAVRRAAQPVRD